MGQNREETISTDQVKSLGDVYEGNIQRHILSSAFFLELRDREKHIYCRSLGAETTVGFWVDTVAKLLQANKDHSRVDLANNT